MVCRSRARWIPRRLNALDAPRAEELLPRLSLRRRRASGGDCAMATCSLSKSQLRARSPPSNPPGPAPGRVVDSSVAIKPNERANGRSTCAAASFGGGHATSAIDRAGAGRWVKPVETLRSGASARLCGRVCPRGIGSRRWAPKPSFLPNGLIISVSRTSRREKIRSDLLRYDQSWPQRQFRLAGDLEMARERNGTMRVTFPLRYELHNGSKSASGTVRKTIILRKTNDGDLEIVKVSDAVDLGRPKLSRRGHSLRNATIVETRSHRPNG